MHVINKRRFLKLRLRGNSKWFHGVLSKKNHLKRPFAESMAILTNDFKLWEVGEIVEYWQGVGSIEHRLNEINWMYHHCLQYGFRRNIPPKCVNIYGADKVRVQPSAAAVNISQYELLNDEELASWLKCNPIVVSKRTVHDGFHRIAAMSGRLVCGKPYVTLYATEK